MERLGVFFCLFVLWLLFFVNCTVDSDVTRGAGGHAVTSVRPFSRNRLDSNYLSSERFHIWSSNARLMRGSIPPSRLSGWIWSYSWASWISLVQRLQTEEHSYPSKPSFEFISHSLNPPSPKKYFQTKLLILVTWKSCQKLISSHHGILSLSVLAGLMLGLKQSSSCVSHRIRLYLDAAWWETASLLNLHSLFWRGSVMAGLPYIRTHSYLKAVLPAQQANVCLPQPINSGFKGMLGEGGGGSWCDMLKMN